MWQHQNKKSYTLNSPEKFLRLKKKALPRTYVISDFNG